MTKHRALVAAAAGVGLLALAVVGAEARGGGGGGGDAKQGTLQAADCQNGSTAVSFGYNKSGDRVTIAVIGSGAAADEVWLIGVLDNGALIGTYSASTSNWSVIDTEQLPKGEHVLTLDAGNNSGETCAASVSFKI